MASARKRGTERGLASPSPTEAAAIATLTAAVQAKAVVEVGTCVGVTGLQILGSMAADGVLTSIDADANHHTAAKEAFAEAGIDAGRARLITGQPSEVLPRLADAAYDLVVINDIGSNPASYLTQSLRLLREGGALIIEGALGSNGAVADPADREAHTVALRELSDAVKLNESLVSVLLPLGDGLLIAIKHNS